MSYNVLKFIFFEFGIELAYEKLDNSIVSDEAEITRETLFVKLIYFLSRESTSRTTLSFYHCF